MFYYQENICLPGDFFYFLLLNFYFPAQYSSFAKQI
jgi:hypothetical protein